MGIYLWHLRQVVKSQVFHAWVTGSNPVGVIRFFSLMVKQLPRKQLMAVRFCLEAFGRPIIWSSNIKFYNNFDRLRSRLFGMCGWYGQWGGGHCHLLVWWNRNTWLTQNQLPIWHKGSNPFTSIEHCSCGGMEYAYGPEPYGSNTLWVQIPPWTSAFIS